MRVDYSPCSNASCRGHPCRDSGSTRCRGRCCAAPSCRADRAPARALSVVCSDAGGEAGCVGRWPPAQRRGGWPWPGLAWSWDARPRASRGAQVLTMAVQVVWAVLLPASPPAAACGSSLHRRPGPRLARAAAWSCALADPGRWYARRVHDSMVPILSFAFMLAGASLVGQLAGPPSGLGPGDAAYAPCACDGRAGPEAVAPDASGRLALVAGGAVSGGSSGAAAAQKPRAPV